MSSEPLKEKVTTVNIEPTVSEYVKQHLIKYVKQHLIKAVEDKIRKLEERVAFFNNKVLTNVYSEALTRIQSLSYSLSHLPTIHILIDRIKNGALFLEAVLETGVAHTNLDVPVIDMTPHLWTSMTWEQRKLWCGFNRIFSGIYRICGTCLYLLDCHIVTLQNHENLMVMRCPVCNTKDPYWVWNTFEGIKFAESRETETKPQDDSMTGTAA